MLNFHGTDDDENDGNSNADDSNNGGDDDEKQKMRRYLLPYFCRTLFPALDIIPIFFHGPLYLLIINYRAATAARKRSGSTITVKNPTNNMFFIRARSSVDQLPVSSNWRKNDITRELMREDLQIELEALKVRLKFSKIRTQELLEEEPMNLKLPKLMLICMKW